MKFEDITPVLESVYVNLAKSGCSAAANALFFAYQGKIKAAHDFSGIGHNPQKFGYGYNSNGMEYEEHSGELFLIFHKAIMDYDQTLASPAARLPFLSYMLRTIGRRAQDVVRFDTKYKNRYVHLSELGRKMKQGGMKPNASDEDILEAAALDEFLSCSQDAERKQTTLKEAVRKAMVHLEKHPKLQNLSKVYLEVADSDDCKRIMTEVAIRVTGDKNKRTRSYYPFRKAQRLLPKEIEHKFYAVVAMD